METIHQQLKNNIEVLKNFRLGSHLNLKAAGTMLESTNVTGLGATHIAPQLLPYIPKKRSHKRNVLDLFPVIPVDSHSLVVANEMRDDGTVSGATAEGDAKNLIDKDDAVTNPTMSKYTSYVKISREMLNDIPFMEDQINRVLSRRVKDAIATSFLADIVGATPTFTAANLTAGTTATITRDCIIGVTADMENVTGYTPNLFLFNQPDYSKLFIEATLNETYTLPTIMTCTEVTAGSIVGLDTALFPLYVYKDMSVDFGYEDDDFTKNLVTIRGEVRLAYNLTGNCLDAIYNDTIVNTLAAIA